MGDPGSYQAMMAQQLMGAGSLAPGMGGQNAATPYGQSFILGNQSQMAPGAAQQQAGMLGAAPPGQQQLMQPMATYG